MKVFSKELEWKIHVSTLSAEGVKGQYTIERVALLMNIVPCESLNLSSQA